MRSQADQSINLIRMILLAVLTLALALRDATATPSPIASLWPAALLVSWLYALLVQAAVWRAWLVEALPWLTMAADMALIGAGVGLELGHVRHSPSEVAATLSWGYALLFLVILFSALRERPWLTLLNGVLAAVLYSVLLIVNFPVEPFAGFWSDQLFRVVFLVLAGLFSSFHARSVRMRRETDARLKVLATQSPGVLFQAEVSSGEFHLRYVSEGSGALLGIEPHDLVARPQLFFSRTGYDWRELLGNPRDMRRSWEAEFPYKAHGRDLWLRAGATVHRDSNGVVVVSGVVTDATEQRRNAEVLREANQAKTDFLAAMSHELRTPLNAILGNADLLSRLATTTDDQKAFRDLQMSGETLLGLIEDILVFSRLEAGRLAAEKRPFRWKRQLEAVVDAFRSQAQAKGLVLVARLSPEPEVIETDALRLRQIVSNLLGNAVKFTASGSVILEASVEAGETPWLVVRVTDTGIGIPDELHDKIFDKFTQGEEGKGRTYGGLGLGLSISRSLAGLLGGTVGVVSQPGRGSAFTLRLPVKIADMPAVATGPDLDPREVRLLVVEDNPTNQDVATRMLRRLGATVDVAASGYDAIELASKRFYDVIFMDWQMPGMDGREATARIRALPGGQDLVIVALSGHALPGDRELLLASGFDDYLSKPVRTDDFRAVLAKWVRAPA